MTRKKSLLFSTDFAFSSAFPLHLIDFMGAEPRRTDCTLRDIM